MYPLKLWTYGGCKMLLLLHCVYGKHEYNNFRIRTPAFVLAVLFTYVTELFFYFEMTIKERYNLSLTHVVYTLSKLSLSHIVNSNAISLWNKKQNLVLFYISKPPKEKHVAFSRRVTQIFRLRLEDRRSSLCWVAFTH